MKQTHSVFVKILLNHLQMIMIAGQFDMKWPEEIIDELFTHSNMSLSDQHSGVMDGVGELSLGNQGLESFLHELTQGHTEDVIELLFVLLQESKRLKILLMRASPSKALLGSDSFRVMSSLAAFLILARVSWTLHISLLHLRP